MRTGLLAILLVGCGTSGSDPLAGAPADCQAGQLHFLYAGMDQVYPLANLVFVNAINNQPGQLHIGMGGSDEVSVVFDQLVPDGGNVAARGFANLISLSVDVGNCDTAALTGHIEVLANNGGYRFVLTDLHGPPYCTGAAVSGTFAACYKGQ